MALIDEQQDPEWVDNDGYPTEACLDRIKDWPYRDLLNLMAFVKSIWWMADWGWRQNYNAEGNQVYNISTGGWSGNESIIGALHDHVIFWSFCFVQVRRGGHYMFEVKHD